MYIFFEIVIAEAALVEGSAGSVPRVVVVAVLLRQDLCTVVVCVCCMIR